MSFGNGALWKPNNETSTENGLALRIIHAYFCGSKPSFVTWLAKARERFGKELLDKVDLATAFGWIQEDYVGPQAEVVIVLGIDEVRPSLHHRFWYKQNALLGPDPIYMIGNL